MKIAYCSDLHLNVKGLIIKNTVEADVLILAGDIVEAAIWKACPDFNQFFDTVSKEFKHVLYVMGNHEHWGWDFIDTASRLREFLPENVILLDSESVEIDGITFVGSTLWTDMNKEDPISMMEAARCMRDYERIQNSNSPVHYWTDIDGKRVAKTRVGNLTVQDTIEEHKISLEIIKNLVKDKEKVVMITHHAPTHLSIDSDYIHEHHLNGAYVSDLSEFILDNPQIKFWTHGHVHQIFDYNVGVCRVLTNPRGYYGYESLAYNFQLKTFEV